MMIEETRGWLCHGWQQTLLRHYWFGSQTAVNEGVWGKRLALKNFTFCHQVPVILPNLVL